MKKIVILALHLSVGGIERVITNVSNLLCENNDVTIISKSAFYACEYLEEIYKDLVAFKVNKQILNLFRNIIDNETSSN